MTTYDRLRAAADVFETDSHYSGSDEQKRRAMYAAQLRAIADELEAVERAMRGTKHQECEDRWYSCPLSQEGCLDSRETACNCHVSTLTALADRIRGEAT